MISRCCFCLRRAAPCTPTWICTGWSMPRLPDVDVERMIWGWDRDHQARQGDHREQPGGYFVQTLSARPLLGARAARGDLSAMVSCPIWLHASEAVNGWWRLGGCKLPEGVPQRREPGLEMPPLVEALREDGLAHLFGACGAHAALGLVEFDALGSNSRPQNSRMRRTLPSRSSTTSSCCTRSILPGSTSSQCCISSR